MQDLVVYHVFDFAVVLLTENVHCAISSVVDAVDGWEAEEKLQNSSHI